MTVWELQGAIGFNNGFYTLICLDEACLSGPLMLVPFSRPDREERGETCLEQKTGGEGREEDRMRGRSDHSGRQKGGEEIKGVNIEI